jgi:uncharacterized protein (TIGR02246 family)
MNSSDSPVLAMQATWSAAASPWDPAALTGLYTPDALFHGGRPAHSRGRAEILAYFESYRGLILACAMEWQDFSTRWLGSDALLAQGHVQFRFVLKGDQPSASHLRATWVLVRGGSGWLIAQHHFSPPPEAPPLGN